MKFKGKRSIISKVNIASKSPTLVFNDDYNNQYKLGLTKIRENSEGGDYYGFALGSTVTLPNGKTLKSLDALNKVKKHSSLTEQFGLVANIQNQKIFKEIVILC